MLTLALRILLAWFLCAIICGCAWGIVFECGRGDESE